MTFFNLSLFGVTSGHRQTHDPGQGLLGGRARDYLPGRRECSGECLWRTMNSDELPSHTFSLRLFDLNPSFQIAAVFGISNRPI